MNPTLWNKKFYAILDAAWVPPRKMGEMCERVLAGGAQVVQLRAKKRSPEERIQILDTLYPLCRRAGAVLVVNDHPELALRKEGVGLHVGQGDMPVLRARQLLGPGRVLGLSTHSAGQAQGAAARAALLDYFAVGPVFATQTKPDYVPVGLALVRQVADMRPPLPWFAIGGITRENAAQVRAAGAARVVAVSGVLCAEDPEKAVREYLAAL